MQELPIGTLYDYLNVLIGNSCQGKHLNNCGNSSKLER